LHPKSVAIIRQDKKIKETVLTSISCDRAADSKMIPTSLFLARSSNELMWGSAMAIVKCETTVLE
jgi:hypothetical protein